MAFVVGLFHVDHLRNKGFASLNKILKIGLKIMGLTSSCMKKCSLYMLDKSTTYDNKALKITISSCLANHIKFT